MTCREATDFLSDYLANDLPADVRQVFEEHLALCPNCRAFLSRFRATVEAEIDPQADADAATVMPEELVRGIRAALARPKP